MSYLSQPLGQLATELPGATAVFHRYGLDFCCNGQRTLEEAITRKSLDSDAVLAELAALGAHSSDTASHTDWRGTPNDELIAYILKRYHERHREQLPELIRLSRRVEHVHGDHPECPRGLAEHLEAVFAELESHMAKEEQILFPMLIQGNYPYGPISVMEEEHVQHGEALEHIESLTNEIQLPHGACNTWTALYVGLREFKRDIMDHIHLENYILFQPEQQVS